MDFFYSFYFAVKLINFSNFFASGGSLLKLNLINKYTVHAVIIRLFWLFIARLIACFLLKIENSDFCQRLKIQK